MLRNEIIRVLCNKYLNNESCLETHFIRYTRGLETRSVNINGDGDQAGDGIYISSRISCHFIKGEKDFLMRDKTYRLKFNHYTRTNNDCLHFTSI